MLYFLVNLFQKWRNKAKLYLFVDMKEDEVDHNLPGKIKTNQLEMKQNTQNTELPVKNTEHPVKNVNKYRKMWNECQ